MKDILALFKRDAEYDQKHVDDVEDGTMFSRHRVLDNGERGELTEKKKRKEGSLGFRKDDGVYGRR